jgi:hypothetical protein
MPDDQTEANGSPDQITQVVANDRGGSSDRDHPDDANLVR